MIGCFLTIVVEGSGTMSEDKGENDVRSRRELLASAAEKRLSLSPCSSELSQEQSTSIEDQTASASCDIKMSQSLFAMLAFFFCFVCSKFFL